MGFKAELLRQYMLYSSSFCSVSVVYAFLDLSIGFLGKNMVGVTMIIIIISGMLLVLNSNHSRFPFRKHCPFAAADFITPFFLQALQFLGKGPSGLFSHHHPQSHLPRPRKQ